MDDLWKARAFANGLAFEVHMMQATWPECSGLWYLESQLQKIVSGDITEDEAIEGVGG